MPLFNQMRAHIFKATHKYRCDARKHQHPSRWSSTNSLCVCVLCVCVFFLAIAKHLQFRIRWTLTERVNLTLVAQRHPPPSLSRLHTHTHTQAREYWELKLWMEEIHISIKHASSSSSFARGIGIKYDLNFVNNEHNSLRFRRKIINALNENKNPVWKLNHLPHLNFWDDAFGCFRPRCYLFSVYPSSPSFHFSSASNAKRIQCMCAFRPI